MYNGKYFNEHRNTEGATFRPFSQIDNPLGIYYGKQPQTTRWKKNVNDTFKKVKDDNYYREFQFTPDPTNLFKTLESKRTMSFDYGAYRIKPDRDQPDL